MKKIINPWKDMEGYNCFGGGEHLEAASGVSRVAEYAAWWHSVGVAG